VTKAKPATVYAVVVSQPRIGTRRVRVDVRVLPVVKRQIQIDVRELPVVKRRVRVATRTAGHRKAKR
jgi:hypothetical protein